MRTLVDRAAAGVVLGMCFAVAGCSSTTAIRPDQLLILTQAAARNAEHAAEVIDASGKRVRVEGTLDKVEITLVPEGLRKTFHAPMEAKVDGSTLVVVDEKKRAMFAMDSMQGVKVTYADKDLMLAGGVVLDILGGIFLTGATVSFIFAATADHGVGPVFLMIALPGLAISPAFLVPGIILTRSGARTPKYPLRPGPRVEARLGSVRVSF